LGGPAPILITIKMNSNEYVDFNNAHSNRVSRLYLTSIVRDNLLNRKDFRSIKKWCKINSVAVTKDLTGEYVIKEEFDLAYNLPVIQKLIAKYGDSWKTYYPFYLNNEVYKIVELDMKSDTETRYIPKGSIAKKYKNG
jgi:hypothetical protein